VALKMLAERLRVSWRHLSCAKVDGRGAAAVRILLNGLFLTDLIRVYPRHETLYFLEPSAQAIGLLIWAGVTLFELIGLWTRAMALSSFCCGLMFVVYNGANYHVDYYHQIVSFYLTFIESDRCWSVRAFLARRARVPLEVSIAALPVWAFQLHLATLYLDTGLSHVMANQSWREGYAVSQSLLHPQWSTQLGRLMARLPGFALLANWATVLFEVAFIFALLAYTFRRSRTHLALALVCGGLVLHLGITLCYDIGLFGPQLVLLMPIFLPDHAYDRLGRWWQGSVGVAVAATIAIVRVSSPRAAERLDSRPASAPAGLASRLENATAGTSPITAGALAVVMAAALLVQQPVRAVIDKALLEGWTPEVAVPALRVYQCFANFLHILGDTRPHNVFSEYSQGAAFAFEVEATFTSGRVAPVDLLFRPDGERVGATRYMRNFMHWYTFGQRMARHELFGETQDLGWRSRFEQILSPVLRAELKDGSLRDVTSVTVTFHAWRVPRGGHQVRKIDPTPRRRVATVQVLTPEPGVFDLDFAYPSRETGLTIARNRRSMR
jgi:hypothetical protein